MILRYLFCGFVCAAVIAQSVIFQDAWTYNGGLGWDGEQYAKLTGQCGRAPLEASEPFAYRVGVPCLAALLPLSPKYALWTVNVIASILLIFLLDTWLRRHVPPSTVPWLVVGFALHWLTPLRHVWWYPTYIDPPAMCALVAGLLVAGNVPLFAAVCFTGALIRETMVVVPAAFAAGGLLRWYRRRWHGEPPPAIQKGGHIQATAAGLASCAAAMLLAHAVVTPTTDYWMLDSALYWAYEKPLPRYVLAWFITFGPALVLIAVHWQPVGHFLRAQPEHGFLLAFVAGLAWIGGTDTERFLLWSTPVVLVMFGLAAEQVDWRRAKWAACVLLVAQAINGRWFVATPDHVLNEIPRVWPLLTPLTATRSALLFSETPDRMMSAVALAQYVAVSALLLIWFKAHAAASFSDRRRVSPTS